MHHHQHDIKRCTLLDTFVNSDQKSSSTFLRILSQERCVFHKYCNDKCIDVPLLSSPWDSTSLLDLTVINERGLTFYPNTLLNYTFLAMHPKSCQELSQGRLSSGSYTKGNAVALSWSSWPLHSFTVAGCTCMQSALLWLMLLQASLWCYRLYRWIWFGGLVTSFALVI